MEDQENDKKTTSEASAQDEPKEPSSDAQDERMSQDSNAESMEVDGEAKESDEAGARDEAARENRRVPAGCLNISIDKLGVQKYAQILLNYMNYRKAKGRQVKEQEGLHRDLEMLMRYLRSEMSEDEKNQKEQELQSILKRLHFSSQEAGEAEEIYRSALEEEEEGSAENKDENASDEVPSEPPTSPKSSSREGASEKDGGPSKKASMSQVQDQDEEEHNTGDSSSESSTETTSTTSSSSQGVASQGVGNVEEAAQAAETRAEMDVAGITPEHEPTEEKTSKKRKATDATSDSRKCPRERADQCMRNALTKKGNDIERDLEREYEREGLKPNRRIRAKSSGSLPPFSCTLFPLNYSIASGPYHGISKHLNTNILTYSLTLPFYLRPIWHLFCDHRKHSDGLASLQLRSSREHSDPGLAFKVWKGPLRSRACS